jgi:two-component system phosphate regulon response regulator PhoB
VIQPETVDCALQTVKELRPDLVIMDWMLPDAVDIDLCRRIRSESSGRGPLVIMISECSGESARLRGFEAGADDYVVKPVSIAELKARVDALLRRVPGGTSSNVYSLGDFSIDRYAHRVRRGKRTIKLGPKEYRILEYFIEHPGRLVTRHQLLEALWPAQSSDVVERTIDVHIGRLRKAICRGNEPDPIRTIRSEGYVFVEAD